MVDYKNVLMTVLGGLAEVAQKALQAIKEDNDGSAPVLITSENHPEVIKAVTDELRASQADLVLARLQDLEKAVYHIAVKQQEVIENLKGIEEMVVSTASSVEEIVNGINEATDEFEADGSEGDDDLTGSLWETKKASSPLN